MDAKKLNIRLIYVLIILLIISTKVSGAIHIIGSLEFHIPNNITNYTPWIKVKQDLIKRKGLAWLLTNPDLVQVYILNRDSECGLFICGRDSTVLLEIKNSLDELSKSDETIVVQYAYPSHEILADGGQLPFDSGRYKSDWIYRDSIDTAISKRRFNYVKGMSKLNRYQKYWFMSDSILYDSPRCTILFSYIFTQEVIGVESVIAEYLAECSAMGYTPLVYGDSRTLPAWVSDMNAIDRPEMQLLHRYVKKNDSLILNTLLPADLYDINFKYDHRKIENVKSMTIGRKPLNERNIGELNTYVSTRILTKLLMLTSANICDQLICCSIIIHELTGSKNIHKEIYDLLDKTD